MPTLDIGNNMEIAGFKARFHRDCPSVLGDLGILT